MTEVHDLSSLFSHGTRWDEDQARPRPKADFDHADRETQPGCWASCYENRSDLLKTLNGAFDANNLAFHEQSLIALEQALASFDAVIREVLEPYRLTTLPPELHQRPRD